MAVAAASTAGLFLLQPCRASLPLCDDTIVKETCSLIGDASSGTTSRGDVEELTSSTADQVGELWAALGIAEDRVDCTALCYGVVGFLSQDGVVPPTSDTACYEVDGQDGNIRCDLDISHLAPGGDTDDAGHDDRDDLPPNGGQHHGHGHSHSGGDGTGVELGWNTHELAIKVANLYRIFPASNPTFEDGAGAAEVGAAVWAGRRLDDDWRSVTATIAAQATADITHAIRHIRDPRTVKYMSKWFGKVAENHPEYRKEMLRVMNSVTHTLDNADYIFPGPDCTEDTYAYVFPKGRQALNKDGKYKVFLCPLFLKDKKAQRETLTHEASHHSTAFTDDVCMESVGNYHKSKNALKIIKYKSELPKDVHIDDEVDIHWDGDVYEAKVYQIRDDTDEVILLMEPNEDCEDLAYGRQTCIGLARKSPLKALRNADSFCYFIQDLADHVE